MQIFEMQSFTYVLAMFPTTAIFGIFILQTLSYFLPVCQISHFELLALRYTRGD